MENGNRISISKKLEMDDKQESILKICVEFMYKKKKAIKEFLTILTLIIIIIVLVVIIVLTR